MQTLNELRTSLTAVQRAALNTIYEYEQKNNKHMPVMRLYELCGGEQAVENALSELGDRVLLKHPSNGGRRRYGLNFLGYLLSAEGEKIQEVLVRYFECLRSKLREDPEFNGMKFDDLLKEQSHFSEDERTLFKKIIYCTPFHNGDGGIPPNSDDWYFGDLNSYIERVALRDYRSTPGRVINLYEQPQIQYFGASHLTTENLPSATPESLSESLRLFENDYPNPAKVGFVMMRFGKNVIHETLFRVIAEALKSEGLTAVRADDKEYHEDLFCNVETYMHGCGFGIAVFEHAEGASFNPNVALEVGYMKALKKHVCLLKDQSLATLQADLAGKLYRNFDLQNSEATISRELSSWLKAKRFVP